MNDPSAVRRVTLPSGALAWVVSDWQLARKVLNDPRFSKRRPCADHSHYLFRHMLTLDPPEHTRLRALISGFFLPGRIQQLRARIETDCRELLEGLHRRTELVAEFARPLALRTICTLTGVPREDAPRIEDWSQRLVRADFEDASRFPVIAEEMCGRFEQLLGCTRDDSVITYLAGAVSAGTLNKREMFSMIFLLLNAGYETSANLISSGLLSLLCNRSEWTAICREPSLASRAVEELLRFESPLQMSTPRFAVADVELAGETIAAGEMIFAALGAANRDAEQFPHADRLDIARENASQHIAFGHGVHFCIGAPLARIEGEIAIAAFAQRFPSARPDHAAGEPVWEPGFVLRGLRALHLLLGPEMAK